MAQYVISATRTHFPAGTKVLPEATKQHLKDYAISTQKLGISAAIAVNMLDEEITEVLEEAAPDLDIKVLHVPVWGAFVPALNTLLGEAQRRGFRHILYQSLEVQCTPAVLEKMLDYFTPETLVVGPVLDGHTFTPGETALDGRTTPWNTLALWSIRKLGLTGFLHIADGMPERQRRRSYQALNNEPLISSSSETDCCSFSRAIAPDSPMSPTMGSEEWWETPNQAALQGLCPKSGGIAAGVEEVTAVALLQHLLGEADARAVLIEMPASLVTWKADWGGDERRKAWHEYKMASKVSRPAVQLEQLFAKRTKSVGDMTLPLLSRNALAKAEETKEQKVGDEKKDTQQQPPAPAAANPTLTFGVVQHCGDSISPARQVELICLAATALFSLNFASSFAAAFWRYNQDGEMGAYTIAFVCLLAGGVYLPMPLSLCITRFVTSRADHIAGLTLFAATLFFTHMATAFSEASGMKDCPQEVLLLCVRCLEGLASGVLFQARFILASVSTQDQHQRLQVKSMFASDLGLGFGALLPTVAAFAAGRSSLSRSSPDMLTSIVLVWLSLALLVWILVCFPRKLHRLPDRVRFAAIDPNEESSADMRARLVLGGTTRVFVQSASMMMIALIVKDAGLAGDFMQSSAIAFLCFVQAPFEALALGLCCPAWMRPQKTKEAAMAIVMLAIVIFATNLGLDSLCVAKNNMELAITATAELALIQVALAMAAPVNVARLNQHKDAERSLVMLEWLKAYAGRLLAPMFALTVQHFFGYDALFACLCVGTVTVAYTA